MVVQLAIPALPETFQLTVPVGALAPAVPVTVVVKVRVELSAPPPLAVRTAVGVTLAITTETGAVAANAVKLLSPL